MKTILDFDYQKSVQALNYLAQKEGGVINKLKVIKLIWLVDRYHLRKYGRPITNDTYYAMNFGPVGSSVKDIAQCSVLSDQEESYTKEFLKCDEAKLFVQSVKNVDSEIFSDSEIEALDAVYSECGQWDQFKLADFSHNFPEWKKFETALDGKITTREVMTYLDFFQDPKNVNLHIFDQDKSQLAAARQEFETNYELANFWI